MKKTILTTCIVRHENRILLGRIKLGMSKDKWAGFGGHVKEGETAIEAAKREMKEESGITVDDVELMGILTITSPSRGLIELHIFKATEFQGELVETPDAIPKWFAKEEIPFREMWPADLYWWPYFYKNRHFMGEFELDKDDRVISHEVKAVVGFDAA
jgi:8-oxo-dGTP pyrophosphatase MutT (NUDIX family)